eukprot:51629_1
MGQVYVNLFTPQCCAPSKDEGPLGIIKTKIINTHWADAVIKQNMVGIRMIHATDPEVINTPIDEHGCVAIHIAVKHKNRDLLIYLLTHNANVNRKGGLDANTALHEAVLMKDTVATKWLFTYNANPDLINRYRKRPFDLCDRDFKREYMKAKISKKKYKYNRKNVFEQHSSQKSHSPITVGGISIDKTQSLQDWFKKTNEDRMRYKLKKEEIEKREMPITIFGNNVGIDIDEIALILQKIPTKQRLWNSWVNNENILVIHTKNDVYKIVFGLCWVSLKKKYGINAKKPCSLYIKQVTRNLCVQYLPHDNGRLNLTRDDFIENFHSYLYKLHDQMVDEQ